MNQCEKCKREFKKLSSARIHEKFCDGSGCKLDKKKKSASWKCPKCKFHIHSKRDRHVEICDGLGPNAHKRIKKLLGRGKDWSKGTNLSEDHKQKISSSLMGKSHPCKDEPARREKISKALKGNPKAGGYRPGSGIGQSCWYQSEIAGEVWLDSSYEKRLAIYLDTTKVNWIRNKTRFDYVDENGDSRKYIPDFYLPDLNLYLEVKGYSTLRDELKWKSLGKTLKVFFEKDISDLEHGLKNLLD